MKTQQGLTIAELMIAMVVGLFVLGGSYAIFTMSASSVQSTGQQNQIQDSARMALRMLQDDLSQAGFFADLTGLDLIPGVNLLPLPAIAGIDCNGAGPNNRTFPNNIGHFRTLWAYTEGHGPKISCLSGNRGGSDVLQIKRLLGPQQAAGDEESDRYYFINNLTQGRFYAGSGATPAMTSGRIWQYQHRVYYVANNDAGVPSLFRRSLNTADLMGAAEELVEGVEEIKYQFGLDADGDSFVDSYLTAREVTNNIWDQVGDNRIVAVRINILLRSATEDSSMNPSGSTTFQMPDANKVIAADKHRRRLLSATVMMRNPILTARKG
ncbi:PilW family protein [uncultured Ferrimonas sp.]|uniref:PilW family protein n=1 Tax=uncultured Ferrimonas sp. TaxID=432640 RepID=UPI002636A42B|nr:PilW family protein [uncultured Ferrimonas sp.]